MVLRLLFKVLVMLALLSAECTCVGLPAASQPVSGQAQTPGVTSQANPCGDKPSQAGTQLAGAAAVAPAPSRHQSRGSEWELNAKQVR